MVEIRRLKPVQQIRMPTKRSKVHKPTQVTVIERRRRDHLPPTPQPTPCVIWQGTQGSDGYGWRKIRNPDGSRRNVSMHRWVMEQVVGRRLKPTEIVLHACDNPLCYREAHLSIGTVADNNADMKAKGRNVKPPINRFYGEAHPMAKLTAAQVRAIRGHYQSGLKISTIAADFEISPTTVRRIVKGMTWATGPSRDLIAEYQNAQAQRAAPERTEPVKRHRDLRNRYQ